MLSPRAYRVDELCHHPGTLWQTLTIRPSERGLLIADFARARDPELLRHYEVTLLPAISVANVRALLRAALPLPQLSPTEAAALVVKHLDNRTRSRKSRMMQLSGPEAH